MKPSTLMVCKGLLERCPSDLQKGLIELLPPEDRQMLSHLPPLTPFEPEHLKADPLDRIHSSWMAPYLRTLAESEIRLFLATLSKEQAQNLKRRLGLKNHLPTLTRVGKEAIRSLLHEQIFQGQDLAPLAFLPDYSLNFLLGLEEKTLTQLFFHLGLHDLSFEMRQIISTKELKKIFAALSQKEGEYLSSLLLHREPLVFKRLFLADWDGTKEHLRRLLEERGIHRLGHALFGASESMVWYLTHKIDMHLGTLLLKYREKPTHERTEALVKGQIQKILAFFKTEEEDL